MKYQITGTQIIQILKENNLFISCDAKFETEVFSDIFFIPEKAHTDFLLVIKDQEFMEGYKRLLVKGDTRGYISEKRMDTSVPAVITADAQKAMGLIARKLFCYDPKELTVCGITGTKGKTTTVYYMKNIIETAVGRKCAFSSTVHISNGSDCREAELTTPESVDSYRLFAEALNNGCTHMVMEISSQSDKMQRLVGMEFQYGIFTNFSEDHISPKEHKDINDYLSCKKNIAARFCNGAINLDDAYSGDMIAAAKNAERCMTFSVGNTEADIYAKDIVPLENGTGFTVVTPLWEQTMETSILGAFNVSNALGAITVAYMMGCGPKEIAQAVKNTFVPGRMKIFEKDGFIAVVDYAHNRLSMRAALSTLKQHYPNRRIIALFGCPGGKGIVRRKAMAEESAVFCHKIYLTAEDPSWDDTAKICREIESYMPPSHDRCITITDRKLAIETAIAGLKKDEILLIAGKGDENFMSIGGVRQFYEGDTMLAERNVAKK